MLVELARLLCTSHFSEAASVAVSSRNSALRSSQPEDFTIATAGVAGEEAEDQLQQRAEEAEEQQQQAEQQQKDDEEEQQPQQQAEQQLKAEEEEEQQQQQQAGQQLKAKEEEQPQQPQQAEQQQKADEEEQQQPQQVEQQLKAEEEEQPQQPQQAEQQHKAAEEEEEQQQPQRAEQQQKDEEEEQQQQPQRAEQKQKDEEEEQQQLQQRAEQQQKDEEEAEQQQQAEQRQQQYRTQSSSRISLRQKFVWKRSEEQRQCSRCGSKYHYHWDCPESRSCARCSRSGPGPGSVGTPGGPHRCYVVVQRIRMMRELKYPEELQQLDGIFHGLVRDGHSPSLQAYTAYLAGLAASGRVQEAESVLAEMEERADEVGDEHAPRPDVVAYNVVINAWCALERMDDATRVLERMKRCGCAPVTSTYNTLVKGWGLARQPRRAADLVREMVRGRDPRARPNARTYNALVQAWCRAKKVGEARKVVRMMRAAGVPPDVVSFNTLARGYGEAGRPEEAEKVIEDMLNAYVRPNERTYAMVVAGFCRAGNLGKAVSVVEAMRVQGVCPNVPVFNVLVKAYAELLDPPALNKVFALMESHGLNPDASTFGVILDVWCTAGLLYDAQVMLRRMQEQFRLRPDVVAYSTLAKGYARAGRPAAAHQLLHEMTAQGLTPNVVTYTTVMSGWCSLPDMDAAMRVLDEMRRAGVAPTLTTYHTLIWGFNEARQPHKAEAVLDLVRRGGMVPDRRCLELVAQAWCAVGSPADAQRVMEGAAPASPAPEAQTEQQQFDRVSRLIADGGADWRQSSLVSVDGGGLGTSRSSPSGGMEVGVAEPASTSGGGDDGGGGGGLGVVELGKGIQICRPSRVRDQVCPVRYALPAGTATGPGPTLFRSSSRSSSSSRWRSDECLLPSSHVKPVLHCHVSWLPSPGNVFHQPLRHHHCSSRIVVLDHSGSRGVCPRKSGDAPPHHPYPILFSSSRSSGSRRTDYCCRSRAQWLVRGRQVVVPRESGTWWCQMRVVNV